MIFRKRMIDINREVDISPSMKDKEAYDEWKAKSIESMAAEKKESERLLAERLAAAKEKEEKEKEKEKEEKEKEAIDNTDTLGYIVSSD